MLTLSDNRTAPTRPGFLAAAEQVLAQLSDRPTTDTPLCGEVVQVFVATDRKLTVLVLPAQPVVPLVNDSGFAELGSRLLPRPTMAGQCRHHALSAGAAEPGRPQQSEVESSFGRVAAQVLALA